MGEIVDLDLLNINIHAVNGISKVLCENYNIFPYDVNENEFYLASVGELTKNDITELRFLLKKNLKTCICEKNQFVNYINKYYEDAYRMSMVDEFKNSSNMEVEVKGEEQVSGPIISLVDSVLKGGVIKGASDIHIEPLKDKVLVRYRIDGRLKVFSSIPKSIYERINTRIKVMSEMDIACKYVPQDGEISMNIEGEAYDFRISTLPTINGEKFVIRIFRRNVSLVNMDMIGFDKEDYLVLKNILKFKQGLIIITGPTGSGKTTTLYSMIKELNNEGINIITVEKPVECEVEGINQVSIGGQGNITYGSILKSVLRQDPDVIMVGEIIDKDTAEIAIRASLTGHLVLTTLHTNDAATTINRLTNMGIDSDLIKDSLVLVIAQRLTRVICECCKKTYKLSNYEKKLLCIENCVNAHKGMGCVKCNGTGYKGRIIAYEIMTIGKELKNNILSGDSDIIRDIAVKNGMTTIDDYFKTLILKGYTSIEEYYSNLQVYNIEKALGVDYGI
ncbi:MAG: GspE/PulE family protein [Clostridium sp.]|uniref:GspE/PulE family protein n=1 Tax=Clostridium sp. TaxID=1506 RepID=UPI00301F4A6C